MARSAGFVAAIAAIAAASAFAFAKNPVTPAATTKPGERDGGRPKKTNQTLFHLEQYEQATCHSSRRYIRKRKDFIRVTQTKGRSRAVRVIGQWHVRFLAPLSEFSNSVGFALAPWQLGARFGTALNTTFATLGALAVASSPFIPAFSRALADALGFEIRPGALDRLGELRRDLAGVTLAPPPLLAPRLAQ